MNSKKFIYPSRIYFDSNPPFRILSRLYNTDFDSIQRYSFCKHLRGVRFFTNLKTRFKTLECENYRRN
ncbi:hypothetical protein LEP1GSC062_0306 [Leptospira alexanderi serovar Manhao 3 str. L 60]|uniref:Uncharacterized protein n=1 Tax=Leptospira alexanderi serovar Manhao 3 str. L 60 TaxID=1049759 RepID=V6IA82_9LEPT|nr:hypothetical protein LEP1GSC062_0306 [Leptospira alexanderi serovar Manhao 3 str. L 60]